MNTKAPFYCRIRVELLRDLRKLARLEDATITSIVEAALEAHLPARLDKHGVEPQPPAWRSWGQV